MINEQHMTAVIEWLNITPGQDDFAALLAVFWLGCPAIGWILAKCIMWGKS